jgi:hypothetical protein
MHPPQVGGKEALTQPDQPGRGSGSERGKRRLKSEDRFRRPAPGFSDDDVLDHPKAARLALPEIELRA